MKLDEAIAHVLAQSGPAGLDAKEVYQILRKMADVDQELYEDWLAEDQETLRRQGREEAQSRRLYIEKESNKKR